MCEYPTLPPNGTHLIRCWWSVGSRTNPIRLDNASILLDNFLLTTLRSTVKSPASNKPNMRRIVFLVCGTALAIGRIGSERCLRSRAHECRDSRTLRPHPIPKTDGDSSVPRPPQQKRGCMKNHV